MATLMPCQELQCDKLGLIQNWWVETWEGQVHHNPGLHAWILAGSSCRGRSAQNCVCNLFQFWIKSLWSSSNISTYDGSPYRRAGKLHSSLLRWSCHLQWNWKSVLHKLSEAGLPIKLAKCQFIAIYNNACNFHSYCLNWEPKFFKFLLDCFHWVHLSHIAGGSMGQTSSWQWSNFQCLTPRNKKQVRSFLGLTGCYCRFIPDYASIAVPQTRKSAPNLVKWDSECNRAFEKLRGLPCSKPEPRFYKRVCTPDWHFRLGSWGCTESGWWRRHGPSDNIF